MFGKMQASGPTEFIPFICITCFLDHLASCFPPAPQQSPLGGGVCTDPNSGSARSHLEAETTDGCDISCLLVRQEMLSLHNAMLPEVECGSKEIQSHLSRE